MRLFCGIDIPEDVRERLEYSTFTFTDTYATLSPKTNCSLVATGQFPISGNTMAGHYTEVDSCNGAVRSGRSTATSQ